ncbi:MAG: glycosyltransferase [Bacteroidetes bacterium]|nr:glycosyltransferase [Bacteroidota bacterium]
MDKINIQRVLIAPLDWGLGHATRCIPIIKAFQLLHYEVIIAADGPSAKLLTNEFPELRVVHLDGYHIQYASTAKGLPWKLFLQIPKILSSIKKEHQWLDTFIQKEKIDLIISDNRYGVCTNKVPCVFITHQLLIKTPYTFLEKFIQKINYHFINHFSACWVPDNAGEPNVAGVLSHPSALPKIPVHYLGILSRMQVHKIEAIQFDHCFLISGPEPQRTLLEKKIVEMLPLLAGKVVIVRGLPNAGNSIIVPSNTKVFDHLSTNELASVIYSSKLIICRSGYTTVMELIGMRKNALLIPTPMQTEQEYLATKLVSENRFQMVSQDELDATKVLAAYNYSEMTNLDIPIFNTNVLEVLLRAI